MVKQKLLPSGESAQHTAPSVGTAAAGTWFLLSSIVDPPHSDTNDGVLIRNDPAPEGTGLPNKFKKMNNLYEMAYWVTTHPDLHHLVNEIHERLGTHHVRGVLKRPPTNDAQVRTSSILCKRYGFQH